MFSAKWDENVCTKFGYTAYRTCSSQRCSPSHTPTLPTASLLRFAIPAMTPLLYLLLLLTLVAERSGATIILTASDATFFCNASARAFNGTVWRHPPPAPVWFFYVGGGIPLDELPYQYLFFPISLITEFPHLRTRTTIAGSLSKLYAIQYALTNTADGTELVWVDPTTVFPLHPPKEDPFARETYDLLHCHQSMLLRNSPRMRRIWSYSMDQLHVNKEPRFTIRKTLYDDLTHPWFPNANSSCHSTTFLGSEWEPTL